MTSTQCDIYNTILCFDYKLRHLLNIIIYSYNYTIMYTAIIMSHGQRALNYLPKYQQTIICINVVNEH